MVDDDPTTLTLLSAMLRQEGFAALCAGSLQQARALAGNGGFDLAILDVNLPDGNGLELCRWLGGQPSGTDVPVLMLSAEQDVRTKVAGFESGAVDYVTKPFHRAEVMARVRTHLRLRAAHRSIVELQALKLSQVASAQQALMPQPGKLPGAGSTSTTNRCRKPAAISAMWPGWVRACTTTSWGTSAGTMSARP